MRTSAVIFAISCLVSSALAIPSTTDNAAAVANLRRDIGEAIINHPRQSGPNIGKRLADVTGVPGEHADGALHGTVGVKLVQREVSAEAAGHIGKLLEGLGIASLLGKASHGLGSVGSGSSGLGSTGSSSSVGGRPIDALLNSAGLSIEDLYDTIKKAVGDATGSLCDASEGGNSQPSKPSTNKTALAPIPAPASGSPVDDFFNSLGLNIDDVVGAIDNSFSDARGTLCDALNGVQGIERRAAAADAKISGLLSKIGIKPNQIQQLLKHEKMGKNDHSLSTMLATALGRLMDTVECITDGNKTDSSSPGGLVGLVDKVTGLVQDLLSAI